MTLTIVVTVGLGIGATTTIFAAVDAALLRPLPYARPDRLVRIYTDAPPNKFPFSVADILALQEQQTRFAQVGGYTRRSWSFSDGSAAEKLNGREVSWTYFSLLGIKPVIGRDFTEIDGRPGSPRTVIVSDGFWRRRLGGRPEAIGTAIRLEGADYVVIGVLPPATGPFEQGQEFFAAAQWSTPPRKGPFFITPIARLRDGVERAAAAQELRAINRRMFPIWRASYQDEKATWSMMDLKAYVTGDVETTAGLALAAVGLVWLIACANASNLLIARVTSRRRELAVRAALGASRERVVRYLLAESALLAVAAATVGVGLAWAGVTLLRDLASPYFPRTHEIALDGSVLLLLAALATASTLLFGLVPAVHGTGGPIDDSLRSVGRSSTGSVAVRRMRRVLVGSQFAIATPLLVVAGLFLATLAELGRVDLGFDARNLATGSITLPAAQYAEPGRVSGFWDELRRRLEALAGVAAVAFADGRPPNGVNNFNNFDLEDFPARGGQQPVTPWIAVTPDYFRLLGLALLEGRLLDDRDARAEDLESVVVDRAWAKRFFPNQSAIGKRFREGGCTACPWTSVVGIVSEVKYAGLDKPDEGTVYAAMRPDTRARFLLIRTRVDASTVLPAVQQALRELDPSLPLSSVATIEELTGQSLQRPRSLSWLVGALAVVALALSVVGIYGVMAYYVQQHAKDISIRLALGANPSGVLKLVVAQGMTVVTGGIGIGLLAALVLTRLISSLLFHVEAADLTTFAGVAVVLLAVGLAACLVPARRATGLEPAVVLRNE
jgi:putative ABC transport system permease protein